MKKFISFILIIGLLLPVQLVCASDIDPETETVAESSEPIYDANEINSIHGIDANNALLGMDKIVNNARAAIVYEANSQTLMYAWNPDAQMYPASLVKIMTVLLALEKAELTDLVTVSQEAISSVPSDAISAKLLPGEKLSMQDLLYCILLSSASDASVAVAEYVGGSVQGFVDMMNKRAEEMGCTGTYFTNPHGLHDDNQHTTARDSARILSEAMANESFRTIFAADDYMIEKTNLSENRRITTGNYMKDTNSKLYYDSRVIGGRTGVTQDGRRCLATAAERNGMLLISVVMGAESVYQEDGYSAISIGGYRETTRLLDVCLDGFKTVQLLYENQTMRQIPIPSGNCDLVIGPRISVSTVLPVDITSADLVYKYDDKPITLPISPGQHVADLQIWHGNMCVAQAEMFALNGVQKAAEEISQDITDDADPSSGLIWFAVIAVIVIICFLVLRYSRKNYKRRKAKEKRKHSHDRRRNR